jgi:hypothetical protein
MVDEQTHDKIIAQTVWICRVVQIWHESPGSPIKAEEPMSISANPEIARVIVAKRYDVGTGC